MFSIYLFLLRFESVSDFTSELEDSDDPTAYVTNLTYYHLVPFETDILDWRLLSDAVSQHPTDLFVHRLCYHRCCISMNMAVQARPRTEKLHEVHYKAGFVVWSSVVCYGDIS